MWVKTIREFNDMTIADPDDRRIPIGKSLNVTADRATELISAGVAVASEDAPDVPTDPTTGA